MNPDISFAVKDPNMPSVFSLRYQFISEGGNGNQPAEPVLPKYFLPSLLHIMFAMEGIYQEQKLLIKTLCNTKS